ncbi:Pycsar system effector family protein [Streptomyces physcomitrii]|uniref:Integral membrane plasmid transfer protein n=1 Tax=Streptomyces physcomitrii TaxID=2724184 RepID=A0ABX1H2M1_9ACTN|nr:Pycsar system effector family protein [Streptomyces physcomitrii]NKI41560.1 integral membrane plasmid transfer protein [Streptomyces physcomitrii]
MSAAVRDLSAAHAEVKAEITRTDSKASLLLAFIGAVLAGVWSAGKDLPLTAYTLAPGLAGIATLLGAASLLLSSVRPNLSGRHGFPLWATLTPEQIRDAVATDIATDIAGLSRIAVTKFTALQRAIDLTRIGGTLLVAATVITLGGAA